MAAKRVLIRAVRDYHATVLHKKSGRPFYHYSSTRTLNGSTVGIPLASKLNRTLFGRYMCWGSKVCTTNAPYLITNQCLAGSLHTMSVRQHKNENPNISLMHIGLIAGTPVFPKIAFSVDLLELFYHIRRRQPSIGVQGFVKAMCAFRQMCIFFSVHPQTTNSCDFQPVRICPLPGAAFLASL